MGFRTMPIYIYTYPFYFVAHSLSDVFPTNLQGLLGSGLSGFAVQGSGFKVLGFRVGVSGLRFTASGLGSKVLQSWFWVLGQDY